MKNLAKNIKNTLKVFCGVSILASLVSVHADDTEVFYSVNVSKPNLMFVLDVSGSMSNIVPNSGETSSVAHTVNRKVSNNNDDAEQAASGGRMLLNDDYLDIGYDYYDFSAPQRIGLRFFDMDIPQGAEITNAYIQFTVRETSNQTSTPIELTIFAEAADSARRFRNNRKIHSRTRIATGVDWNPPVWDSIGDDGEEQRTSDITTLVQSVVDRGNWSNDNGMVFIIEGKDDDTGSRVAYSRDNGSGSAPSLHIEYNTIEVDGDKTRLEVMQTALRRVLETAPDNVNVGLMNYGQENLNVHNNEMKRHHSVSGVAFPIADINALVDPIISEYNDVDNLPDPNDTITVREYLADVADTWSPTSYTPIVDSLYEAALYFRGEKMHYGDTIPSKSGAHPSTYEGAVVHQDVTQSARDNGNGPSYITPMESSCQSNYIVLMTDGEPTYRDSNWGAIKGPFARIRGDDNGPQGALADAIDSCEDAEGGRWQGECGSEITHYIASHDNNSEYEGVQTVKTFAIGFGAGISANTKTYLKSLETIDDDPETAEVEDGYFDADSPETLANAFQKILEQVAEPSGTLASPGYSVNVKSGLEHEKDIYIPVFDRKNTSRWSGNLKKFRIDEVGDQRLIRGKNQLNAVDALGGFTSSAWDYWSESTEADGIDIQKGGVANKLNPATRKLFSNITADKNLSATENLLKSANSTNITNAMLGIPADSTEATRKKLINFIRGWEEDSAGANSNGVENSGGQANSNGVARKHMGDMLHTEPLIVTYEQGDADGSGKKQYIFAGTNEGYLHAFDTETGIEKFAFMPKELLKNIDPQMRNEGTAEDHKYGIDGAITYWHIDEDKNGDVNGSDKVYLYFGLRRGGRSFYALDVTDISEPKFLWTVSATDHPTMGQSWSTPYLGRIRNQGGTCVNGTSNCKEVVVVSGGYDEVEDRDGQAASKTVTTTMGKDIFIFDAKTGDKLWSLQDDLGDTTSITDSIPGGVRVLDTNRNGLFDRMYFADTGGNVWRLDLSDKSSGTSQLTKMATLGGSGRESARKFYNEPDVSVMKLSGKSVYVVSVGTGFRAHPMDRTISDKFYILVDSSPYAPLDNTKYDLIDASDLAKINISGAVGATTVTQSGDLYDHRGWEVTLPEAGEKVLATALTFDGIVTFTTLVPEALLTGDGVDQCAAPATQGRLYGINILTGKAALNPLVVAKGEIPGKPQVVFNSLVVVKDEGEGEGGGGGGGGGGGDAERGEGTCKHPVDIRIGKKLSQATGYDACRLESVYWSDPSTGSN